MALHSPWIVLLGASLRRMSSGTMGCIIHMSKYNQVILFVFFFILRLRIFLTSMFFPPKSTKNDHISCKHSRAFLVSFFFFISNHTELYSSSTDLCILVFDKAPPSVLLFHSKMFHFSTYIGCPGNTRSQYGDKGCIFRCRAWQYNFGSLIAAALGLRARKWTPFFIGLGLVVSVFLWWNKD